MLAAFSQSSFATWSSWATCTAAPHCAISRDALNSFEARSRNCPTAAAILSAARDSIAGCSADVRSLGVDGQLRFRGRWKPALMRSRSPPSNPSNPSGLLPQGPQTRKQLSLDNVTTNQCFTYTQNALNNQYLCPSYRICTQDVPVLSLSRLSSLNSPLINCGAVGRARNLCRLHNRAEP